MSSTGRPAWQASVRVDKAVTVGIDPESAWSLLSSPKAWSARPQGSMAFDFTDPVRPGGAQARELRRLRVLLQQADGRAHAAVLEVTAETPGQMISLQTANGRVSWDLSVQSGRRGTVVRIAATATVDRPAKIHAEAELRAELRAWLSALRDAASGRRPLTEGMPERLRRACLEPGEPGEQAKPGPAIEVTASTVIAAPPDLVRQLYRSAEVARLTQPGSVVCFGPVPGTPGDGQVGEMRYLVSRRSDGWLAARVSLLAASSPGGSVVRLVTPPYDERIYRFEPAGAGTRLEITWRCPGGHAPGPGAHREHAAKVETLAGQLKSGIESVAARGSQPGGTQVGKGAAETHLD